MVTVIAIYAAVSVTFSLGFAAGAWWASRERLDDSAAFDEAIGSYHDQTVVRPTATAVFYCLGQRV